VEKFPCKRGKKNIEGAKVRGRAAVAVGKIDKSQQKTMQEKWERG